MRIIIPGTVILILSCILITAARAGERSQRQAAPPFALAALEKELSFVRGPAAKDGPWPREIPYTFRVYDFKTDALREEHKVFTLQKKPVRIIPHAVGVAEILWAICPRERLAAFNEFSADPDSSFIADQIKTHGPIFKSKQTELVIGYQPDLVFTVFYSSADFKEKLRQARIPCFDLGYFGTIESIKDQVLLIGRIIGEEGNARALVNLMDARIRGIRNKIPRRDRPVRVLYYDEGGYVPGISSNFTSLCTIINAVNVGAEQGIKSWSQIDYETLLKWNPDVIVVPESSKLKELLMSNRVLAYARAIQDKAIYYVPGVYLRVDSQFLLLSADLIAGLIYRHQQVTP